MEFPLLNGCRTKETSIRFPGSGWGIRFSGHVCHHLHPHSGPGPPHDLPFLHPVSLPPCLHRTQTGVPPASGEAVPSRHVHCAEIQHWLTLASAGPLLSYHSLTALFTTPRASGKKTAWMVSLIELGCQTNITRASQCIGKVKSAFKNII